MISPVALLMALTVSFEAFSVVAGSIQLDRAAGAVTAAVALPSRLTLSVATSPLTVSALPLPYSPT